MNETILIVDDDELVRSGLAMNLERSGFTVFTAASGAEVDAVVAANGIDLILCDLVLGDENGMDILRKLQMNVPDTSVMIITGHGSVRSALEALKGGASDYIQKPADPEEVIHRIRMVLDSVNLRRTLSEERTRAEERKKIIHEQLSRSERMSSLGMLAEGAAGDLKQILKPVEGMIDGIMKSLEAEHEAHPMMKSLEDALRKASSVIRDLETIGKSNDLDKGNIQLNEAINQYLKGAEHRRLMELHPKVKVMTELEPELPLVAGSREQLMQMIGNLVTNAVESMPNGGVLQVSTTAERLESAMSRFGSRQSGEYVRIRFEDTAARMSEEDIDRFFEPFYIRSRMGRRVLSGLGMTLVYRVVEDHNGLVDIQAGNGVGNAIIVYLPVSRESDTAILELRPDYTGRESILLVDDNEQQRDNAAEMLRELGYQVTTAENGHDAVEIISRRMTENPSRLPFDLMVVDLILGDAFDGVETYKKVSEIAPGLKAVLASGFADIGRIVEARKLGISRCFQKPYTPENLGKNIRAALDEE